MRQIVYFRKKPTTTIQGIADAGQKDIVVGGRCPPNDLHGHGFIGSMELVGDCIVIRKVEADGKTPHTNYGMTSIKGVRVAHVADAAMVHVSQTDGMLFRDVADGATVAKAVAPALTPGEAIVPAGAKPEQDPPPAKPVQNNQGQQRR
jgi:hypothetical protein